MYVLRPLLAFSATLQWPCVESRSLYPAAQTSTCAPHSPCEPLDVVRQILKFGWLVASCCLWAKQNVVSPSSLVWSLLNDNPSSYFTSYLLCSKKMKWKLYRMVGCWLGWRKSGEKRNLIRTWQQRFCQENLIGDSYSRSRDRTKLGKDGTLTKLATHRGNRY